MLVEQEYIGGIPLGQYLAQQRQAALDDMPLYLKVADEDMEDEDNG